MQLFSIIVFGYLISEGELEKFKRTLENPRQYFNNLYKRGEQGLKIPGVVVTSTEDGPTYFIGLDLSQDARWKLIQRVPPITEELKQQLTEAIQVAPKELKELVFLNMEPQVYVFTSES